MIDHAQKSNRRRDPVTPSEAAALADRLPPHDVAAEQSLLGSLIMAGTNHTHVIGDVTEMIAAADFFKPTHAAIYEAIVKVYSATSSIDSVQLKSALVDAGQFDNVGGFEYLIELVESVPTATSAPHYAKIVKSKARARRLIDACGETLRDAYESTDVEQVIDDAERRIFEVAQAEDKAESAWMGDLVQRQYEAMAKREGTSLQGLATGFHALDDMLCGLHNGELIIVGARPSMGKTAFALNVAEYIAVDNQKPIGVLSLEMSKNQLADRLIASRSGVDSQRIRRNTINDHEWGEISRAAHELSQCPMIVDDTAGLTDMALRNRARRMVAQHGAKLIIIDYLQLMSSPGAENRTSEVERISRAAKAVARELNVPVICLSQLNRNAANRAGNRPDLADLRNSGAVEQDADVVMLLHREDYYHKDDPEYQPTNDAEVVIAKQRNGPVGMVKLHWSPNTSRFHNLTRGASSDSMF